MHIISRSALRAFIKKHGDASRPLDDWWRLAKPAEWENFEELKRDFRTADAVGNFKVFNIKGNQYRLIVDIDYQSQVIYIKYVLTHQEYDKGEWKRDPYY